MKHPKSYDTTPEISRRMSRVHLKQGKAETLLAKALWHKGLRYKRNDKSLPGSPDIAIQNIILQYLLTASFGMDKIGMNARKSSSTIESIG